MLERVDIFNIDDRFVVKERCSVPGSCSEMKWISTSMRMMSIIISGMFCSGILPTQPRKQTLL